MDPDSPEAPSAAVLGEGEAAASAPNRIRRNTACTSCRDSKVRCITTPTSKGPCARCSRLRIACLVDRGHKRMTRRSKLEQLEREVQSIRDAVSVPASGPALHVNVGTEFPASISPHMPSPKNSYSIFPGDSARGSASLPTEIPTPSQTTAYTTPTASYSAKRPSEPRALGSRVFSGESIDIYFDKYFEHFHPYFPVVRARDPDHTYAHGPVLFWTIITVACRRYERDQGALEFLIQNLPREVWTAIAEPPIRPECINALLLLCAWPLPTIRFLSDSSSTYIGIAMNACLLLGLHTGRGSHPEFCLGPHQLDVSDEAARYTWAGYNIISQQVSSYTGYPSLGAMFNQPLEKQGVRGCLSADILSYFGVLLEAQKFCNRVSKTMFACLEGAEGVSEATVRLLEEEFDQVERTLGGSGTELDQFTLMAVRIEIQQYYFIPLPNHDRGSLKRNIIRAYNTSRLYVDLALKLDAAQNYLAHAPHFVFRSLLDATCIAIYAGHSIYGSEIDAELGDRSVKRAVEVLRRTSVKDGDLQMRASKMTESYWAFRHKLPAVGLILSRFPHRIGSSLTFDCLRRWKHNLEDVRRAEERKGDEANDSQDSVVANPGPPDVELPQDIDWDMLVMDFDWAGEAPALISF